MAQAALRPGGGVPSSRWPMRAWEYTLDFASVVTSAQAPYIAATSKPDATGERPESANKWLVLVLAATSAFLMSLDASIVNIGLPAMARDFGVPLASSGAILLGVGLALLAVGLRLDRSGAGTRRCLLGAWLPAWCYWFSRCSSRRVCPLR